VLSVQDEVANAVARDIRIKITPRERSVLTSRRSVDPAAYEAYLRGLYLKPTEENLKSRSIFSNRSIKTPDSPRLTRNLQ